MGNSQLSAAKRAKNDEFYTRMTDIEHELVHYKDHFKGKVVLCNCDDPFESNFFKYFALNFNHLGLKRLIATCYSGSPIAAASTSHPCSTMTWMNRPAATARRTKQSSTSSATPPAMAASIWTTSGTCSIPGRTN